jgi:Flp pilus assembly protein TadG
MNRMKNVPTKIEAWDAIVSHFRTISICAKSNGQSVVEFTLIFVLLLVVAWIPADFGLAFYTGQMALNASREGARIAAADRNLVNANCTMPCSSATAGTPLRAAANRMSTALMPGATISIALQAGTTCDRLVTVAITGPYRFFFYQVLRLLGFNVPNSTTISRSTSMRWEHQC